jgi:hypothetical protein
MAGARVYESVRVGKSLALKKSNCVRQVQQAVIGKTAAFFSNVAWTTTSITPRR